VLSLFAGVLASLINSFLMNVLLLTMAVYLVLCLIATLRETKDLKLVLPVWLGVIATHIVYGVSFLMGLMKRDLKR